MFKKCFWFFLFCFFIVVVKGQTQLYEGDLFIVFSETSSDEFVFVPFVDLEPGTVIYFSDCSADGDYSLDPSEGNVRYTVPSFISAGTVISYKDNIEHFEKFGYFAPGNQDAIIAYIGSAPGQVVRFIHAVGYPAFTLGTFPDNFSNYLVLIHPDGFYKGTRSGTPAELKASINTIGNWQCYLGSGYNFSEEPFNIISLVPRLIINEIHADPHQTEGDANGDGLVDQFQDEFIEIINTTNDSVDLSGYTVSVGGVERHIFTGEHILPAKEAVVIFGGGIPEGVPGMIFTASTGSLRLDDGGESIVIKDNEGNRIDSYDYGTEAGDDQSIARNPDITGNFIKHSLMPGNPGYFSPGRNNTTNAALPIELQNFSVSLSGNTVTLYWQTVSEINSYGFEVERKIETDVWKSIGFITGAGNSNILRRYSFEDEISCFSNLIYYRLKNVDVDGTYSYSDVIEVKLKQSFNYALSQNYPNPFNPSTTIKFDLPEITNVSIDVYNILGQKVALLANGLYEAGSHSVIFDAGNFSSGIYYYKIEVGSFSEVKKMILVK